MKISICIPIYGVEKYIERCARSVLEQSYPNIEYIFVNDCSKDRSVEILNEVIKDYPEKKSLIKVISHSYNRGLAAARNTAIENSTGDFIMHVDSDDYLEKSAVELLVNKQEETGADIVSGNAIREAIEGRELLKEPNYNNKDEMLLQCIKPTLDHVIWRRIIRRTLYTEHNITAKEGVNVGEDWQVIPQLVYYSSNIAKIDNVIYHYNCMNEGSYMNLKNSGFNKKIVIQDISSIEVLEDFFNNKELKYVSGIKHVKIRFLSKYLNLAYYAKEREMYNHIAYKISKMDIKYLKMIGWGNFIKYFINRRYSIRRLYDILRYRH